MTHPIGPFRDRLAARPALGDGQGRDAMELSIKRILYATDLSANSAFVFRYAVDMAKRHDARIVVLHVIEQLSPTTEMLIGFHLDKSQQAALKKGRINHVTDEVRRHLKSFCDSELAGDPLADVLVEKIDVCEGYPVEEILKKVDTYRCDAIVMGTHGKGLIRNTFLGSNARRLLRRVRKPVFIVPLPRDKAKVTFQTPPSPQTP